MIEITSAIAIATITPVLNEEFVDEPPLTGRPLLGSAELNQAKSAIQARVVHAVLERTLVMLFEGEQKSNNSSVNQSPAKPSVLLGH